MERWNIKKSVLSFLNSGKIHVLLPPHHPGDFLHPPYLHFLQMFSKLFPSAQPGQGILPHSRPLLYVINLPLLSHAFETKKSPSFARTRQITSTFDKYIKAPSLQRLLHALYLYPSYFSKNTYLRLSINLYKIEATAVYLHLILLRWVTRVVKKEKPRSSFSPFRAYFSILRH